MSILYFELQFVERFLILKGDNMRDRYRKILFEHFFEAKQMGEVYYKKNTTVPVLYELLWEHTAKENFYVKFGITSDRTIEIIILDVILNFLRLHYNHSYDLNRF